MSRFGAISLFSGITLAIAGCCLYVSFVARSPAIRVQLPNSPTPRPMSAPLTSSLPQSTPSPTQPNSYVPSLQEAQPIGHGTTLNGNSHIFDTHSANIGSALPEACTTLVEEGSHDVFKRYDRLNSLVHLSGGPNAVAPKLTTLLRDPNPITRRAAAGAAGLCGDIGFEHISPPPNGAYVLSPFQSNAATTAFQTRMIPALAICISDSDPGVRLAAARSLRSLAHSSANVSWSKALPALAVALSSPDPELRREAAYTLAVIPADLSVITPALRSALGMPEPLTHGYVFVALMHAAQVNRAPVLSAFLKPLTSAEPVQRRAAAADIRQMAGPLWDGQFWPDDAPTEDYYNNDLEFINLSVWMLPYQGRLSPARQAAEVAGMQAANDAAKSQLMAALTSALSDHDADVRIDAALSLEHIGHWENATLGRGDSGSIREGNHAQALVIAALAQASAAVSRDDPALSQRLQDLRTRILEPHERA